MSRAEEAATAAGRREFDIDWFRGLVCLSLIVLHFYQNGPLFERLYALIGAAGDFAIHHLRLGVESFFILAGFMMAHMLRPAPGENVSVRGYLARRFFRLIIPYWTAVLLATADKWALALVFKGGTGDLPGLREVAAQALLLQEFVPNVGEAAAGYWSMVTLEQFYLLWLTSYWLCRTAFGTGGGGYGSAERAMSWLTLAACLVSAGVLGSGVNTGFYLPSFAIYLTLGMMLYWAVRQRFARPQFFTGVVALAAVAVYSGGSRPIAGLIAVGILMMLCRGFRMPAWGVLRALAFCGRRSYSLYLIHPIVGIRVMTLGRFLPGPWAVGVLIAAGFLATFAAAEVFYRLIELPCQARARKVDYRGRKAAAPAATPAGGEPEVPTAPPLEGEGEPAPVPVPGA